MYIYTFVNTSINVCSHLRTRLNFFTCYPRQVTRLFVAYRNNYTHLVKMHEMIRIVVEKQEIVFTGYPVDLLSSFQGYNDASRIRASGVYIHHFRHFSTVKLPISQSFPEYFRYGTIVVLRDRYELRFVRCYLWSKSRIHPYYGYTRSNENLK